MTRLLVVTAVAAERDAITAALADRATPGHPDGVWVAQSGAVGVLVGGVGPAAAAAATATVLAAEGYDLVLSAGIGGGFAPLAPGQVAVASAIASADLGAQTADGFRDADELGFGTVRHEVAPQLAVELSDRTGGHLGTILTLATATGTAATTTELLRRHPDAVAEAMEGAGVATAAQLHGVPFGEVRAISNVVGPRDRDSWQLPAALTALGAALAAITAAPLEMR